MRAEDRVYVWSHRARQPADWAVGIAWLDPESDSVQCVRVLIKHGSETEPDKLSIKGPEPVSVSELTRFSQEYEVRLPRRGWEAVEVVWDSGLPEWVDVGDLPVGVEWVLTG